MSLTGHRGVQKSKLYIPVIHTLASHFWHQQGNWGQSGVDVSKPAGYAVCDGSICLVLILPAQPQDTVFFSILLSSFLFLATRLFHILPYIRFWPNLVKVTGTLTTTQAQTNGGVRGHDGVTGVKKVIFIKKASSPTEYLALTRDLCICSSLTPSTKVMVLKNCQGSFGVTGVKSSFSQKRHQVLQIM